MASRLFKKILGLNHGHVVVAGSFRPAGSGAPTNVLGKGVASVSRTGTGDYLVTLNDKYNTLIAAVATARVADETDTLVQFGDYVAASKTIEVRTFQESATDMTLADLSADADNVISFVLHFGNGANL